jgi:subtilase family serine protease
MNGLPGGNRGTRRAGAREHLLPGGSATPPTASPPGGAVPADRLTAQPPCYTPQQLRVAYGIQPLLDRGTAGCGQTIVLPECPPPTTGTEAPLATTDIRQDLARCDSMFGLPAARLQVVNTLAHAKPPWLASVEAGDREVVDAPAPGTVIREVLIPSSYTVADVALSIRQDTTRRDRGTGQLEARS